MMTMTNLPPQLPRLLLPPWMQCYPIMMIIMMVYPIFLVVVRMLGMWNCSHQKGMQRRRLKRVGSWTSSMTMMPLRRLKRMMMQLQLLPMIAHRLTLEIVERMT